MLASQKLKAFTMVAVMAALTAGCTSIQESPGGPPSTDTTPSEPSSAAVTLAPTTDACTLLSTAEVTNLLGVPPRLPPSGRSPFPDIQVTCGWAGSDAHGQRVQVVVSATTRLSGYDSALARQPGVVALTGIGDKAAFLPPGTIGAVKSGVFVQLATNAPLTAGKAQETLRRDLLSVLQRMGV